MLLLHALVAAGLRVAPVLQGPALLLQTDHLVLGEAPQVSVELAHGHGHQLVVGEAVLHAQAAPHAVVTLLARVGVRVVVVVMMTVMELLVRPRGGGRRAVGVLTVVVVVMVVVAVRTGVTRQLVGVMRDPAVLVVVVVMLLLRMALVVMRASVPLEPSCLQLLLHVSWRRVPVARDTDQCLHGVLGRQA